MIKNTDGVLSIIQYVYKSVNTLEVVLHNQNKERLIEYISNMC